MSHPGPNAVWTAGWLVYGAHIAMLREDRWLFSYGAMIYYSLVAASNPSLLSQWLFRNNKGSPPVNLLTMFASPLLDFCISIGYLVTTMGQPIAPTFYDYLMLMYILQSIFWDTILYFRKLAHLQRQGKM